MCIYTGSGDLLIGNIPLRSLDESEIREKSEKKKIGSTPTRNHGKEGKRGSREEKRDYLNNKINIQQTARIIWSKRPILMDLLTTFRTDFPPIYFRVFNRKWPACSSESVC